VLPLGALGAVTGEIVIGTVATLRLTTIIITIRTTISIAMSAARDKVTGSTIRNTAEMLPTATGKRRINSEVKVLVAQGAPVIGPVLVALETVREPVEVELQVAVIGPVLAEPEADLEEVEQRIDLVVEEQEIAPEEAEQATGLVAVEQGIDRVEAEQAPDLQHGQPVGALKTK
jgi:hypothetical protein